MTAEKKKEQNKRLRNQKKIDLLHILLTYDKDGEFYENGCHY